MLVGASGTVLVATSTPAGASTAFDMVVTSSSPLPSTIAASALGAASAAAPATTSTPDGFSTSTPDGFSLIHPGYRRSDYVYDSDTVYQTDVHCDDGVCTLLAEVAVQLHEYVNGVNSHAWQLTANMQEYANPGNITWSYFATYYCGVNVKGASDHECDNGAAPSNENMSVNDVVNKPWGQTNSITVFPMVAMSTRFSNGVYDTTKFRGWDTLSRVRTTQLDTKSGDGS